MMRVSCATDEVSRRLTREHWPGTIAWEDIRSVTSASIAGMFEVAENAEAVLSGGGSPCQVFFILEL